MTVGKLEDLKTERTQLGRQIAEGHHLVIRAVDLQTVVIDHDGQVVQLIMSSGHIGFPDLSLLALAVAGEDEDLRVLAEMLGAQRHTDRDGYALTERAGGSVHTGDLLRVRMTLQNAVKLAEVRILVTGEKALCRKHCIVAGCGVTLGEHKAVAILPLGIARIHTHMIKKHAGHQLHAGEGAAGVSAAGICRHIDDIAAHLQTNLGKFCRSHTMPPTIIGY